MGPFTSGAIRHLLLQGEALLTDEVSRDGTTWQRVAAVPEVVPPGLRTGAPEPGIEPAATSLPRFSIALLVVMMASAIGFGLWWGSDDLAGEPACHAAPAPGVDWHTCDLHALKAPSADLRGANLQNANLVGAILPGADLSGARIDYASLHQADLGYAVLRNAVLRGADLREVDFSNADLEGADLSFADLTGARIDGVTLIAARLGNALWVDRRNCAPDSIGTCLPLPSTSTE